MTRRLIVSFVSLTALVLVLLEVPLGFTFATAERDRLETSVQHDAFALALRSEELLEQAEAGEDAPAAAAGLQELADEYEQEQGGRVVFVDAEGDLLADSQPPELPGARPAEGRSFRSRPEIRAALAGDETTGTRHSNTLDEDLLYVAVPIATGGALHGAVRITYPLSFVNERIRDTWLVLAGVGAIVLVAVSLVSVLVARSLTRPLASLEAGAESLGRGALDTRVEVPPGPHEVVTLAHAFNTTAARLEQLLDAQQAFVADASHQLRTPLSALRLRLENLQSAVPVAETADVEGALEEVGRLSMLVDGLLELARAEGHGSAPADVDVHELATRRRDAWAALAEERDVRIEIDMRSPLPARATPGRLEQVLDNLMNNALEVAPRGSTIRVGARREGDRVHVTVSDQGPGMSTEQRSRAFDRFWRVDADDSSGFGLGLAIVRQLVVSDGGDVSLEDAPGGGLTATVSLPAG
jgi:signal transduction histidine kinase